MSWLMDAPGSNEDLTIALKKSRGVVVTSVSAPELGGRSWHEELVDSAGIWGLRIVHDHLNE